jgi:hypothetical protein
MPQRFLRPELTNSARWNAVSFEAQSLWLRIVTLADDYGRYDARPSVLWGLCWTVWNHQNPKRLVTMERTVELMGELLMAGLITIYDAGTGKWILQVEQWKERKRAASKWPDPKPEFDYHLNSPQTIVKNLLSICWQPAGNLLSDCQQVAATPQQSADNPLPPSLSLSPKPSTEPAPATPPTIPQGGIMYDEELVYFEEAKEVFNTLFDRRKRHWSFEEEQLLFKASPFTRNDMALIKAWFSLSKDSPFFDQVKMKRKYEMITFLRDAECNGELDKMHAVEKQLWEYLAIVKRGVVVELNWREGEKEKARALWGDAAYIPENKSELSESARAELERFTG